MGDSFSKYMNTPETHNGHAYAQTDYKTGLTYIHCCHCGKKQFPLNEGAVIKNLVWKCKSSSCKKEFIINVE